MAFSFSQSNGFNAKDFTTYIEAEDDITLTENDVNLIVFINEMAFGKKVNITFDDKTAVFIYNMNNGFDIVGEDGDPTTLDSGKVALVRGNDEDGALYVSVLG